MDELPGLLRGEAVHATDAWAGKRGGWLAYVCWIVVGGALAAVVR